MKDDILGSDTFLMNGANASDHSDPDSEVPCDPGSNVREKCKSGIPWHEMLILQDHDEKQGNYGDDDENSDVNPSRLSFTKEGENWLRISTPLNMVQDCNKKNNFTSPKSSQEDETMESYQETLGEDLGITSESKITSQPIMQTQEPSQTQKTLTQTQTQMLTQETETRKSMGVSLLAYLNQPSQQDNLNVTKNIDLRSSIEVVSGDELLALQSAPKSSPSSMQYPPNNSAFLCFEVILLPGETQSSYLTVKDTRPLVSPSISPKTAVEENNTVVEVDIMRANRSVSVGWKSLPRRNLTVLCPGDRIRITFVTSQTTNLVDNKLSADVAIVMEYRHTHRSMEQTGRTNHLMLKETKADTNIDIHDDCENSLHDHDASFSDDKILDCKDRHLNTFCGTTRRAVRNQNSQEKDETPPHKKLSRPNREFVGILERTMDRTLSGESAIDSNASIAVDSTVNSQQETLRPSRMELLKANSGGNGIVEDREKAVEIISNEKEIDTKDTQTDPQCKEGNGRNMTGELNLEVTEENADEKDNDPSDVLSPDIKIQNSVLGASVEKHFKDRGQKDYMENMSGTTVPNHYTQDTIGPSANNNSDNEHESDNSSDKTIPMTQEGFGAAEGFDDECRDDDSQSKIISDHDAPQPASRIEKSIDTSGNIPLNIEIEDENMEDEDRPQVSQLLLSMETDNDAENDDVQDDNIDGVDPKKYNTQEDKHVTSSPNELGKCENSESIQCKVKASRVREKTREGISTRKGNKKPIESCVGDATSESKEMDFDTNDENIHGENQICSNTLNSAMRDTEADRTEGESDDDTILGTNDSRQDIINSSITSNTVEKETLEHKNKGNGEADHSSLVGDVQNSNAGDNSQGNTAFVAVHEGDVGREQSEARESTSSETEATNSTCVIENCTKEKRSSVVVCEEQVMPLTALISRNKRKATTSDSTRNGQSGTSDTGNVIDSDLGGRTRSSHRATIEPKTVTRRNQDVKGAESPISSGPKKRRRLLTSKNDLIVARNADKLYKMRLNTAIKNEAINVVASGFDQNEMGRITRLCKAKMSNVSQLRINDNIDDDTTICILPTSSNDSQDATCRTLKAIRCALSGIPMVSIAWLENCKRAQKITIPTSFVRTLLPSKIGALAMRDHARYGVARLAAMRFDEPQNQALLFDNTFVFLAGMYSSDKKNGILKLLEEGCATVITSSREASVKLKIVMNSSEKSSRKRFILLVGDRGKAIPKFLQKEVKAALKDSRSRNIYVVDSNWVSLSIACATMLPPADFEPKDGIDLWQLSKELPE